MPPSALHKKLRRLVGQEFTYLSCKWRLIDILGEEDQVVLQRLETTHRSLQSDQYGQASRRCPETLTMPISGDNDPDDFSEELLLLLQGKST